MIQYVIFDLDDTLYPEHEFVYSGFKAVGDYLSLHHSIAGFYDVAAQLFQEGVRGSIFDHALQQLQVSYDDCFIRRLVDVYRSHIPSISLFDDAKYILNLLQEHQIMMGMITDGYFIAQQNKVEALHIAPYFSVIIFSDEYGRDNWKPSSFPYLKIMESFRCTGDQCIYVADNPGKDFITARKLGWQTVHIQRKGGEYCFIKCDDSYQADRTIQSLYELERILWKERE